MRNWQAQPRGGRSYWETGQLQKYLILIYCSIFDHGACMELRCTYGSFIAASFIPANHSFLTGVTPFSEFLKYKKGVTSFLKILICSLNHVSSYFCLINIKKVLLAFHFDVSVYSFSTLVSF